MKTKKTLTAEEIAEFREWVKEARPLTQERIILKKKSPIKRPRHKPALPPETHFTPHFERPTVARETVLKFNHPSISTKSMRYLQQDKLPVEATLDLHGMNATQAETALLTFLETSIQRHYRYIRIIHGKGSSSSEHPILKNKINQWLPGHPYVLAFHSASFLQGGAGAINVLLKRKRKI